MTESFVLDSYAWIEYLRGSTQGAIVKALLSKKCERFTSPIAIAEVCSKAIREGADPEEAFRAMTSRSIIFPILSEHALEAAKIHSSLKKMNPEIGLADAFIVELAKRTGSKVVTGDHHFKDTCPSLFLR